MNIEDIIQDLKADDPMTGVLEVVETLENAQKRIEELEDRVEEYYDLNEKLLAKVEELTKVMEAARDDLLMRGDIDSQGCRVVNMSATTWDNFCNAIDKAALKEGE